MYLQNTSNDTSNGTLNMVLSIGATTILPTTNTNVTHSCEAPSKTKPTSSYDALLYIVVVLSFYACSMVILMIKYVRREKEEAQMAHYYSEFVAREQFKSPRFQVNQYMKTFADIGNNKDVIRDDNSEDYISCLDVTVADDKLLSDQRNNAILGRVTGEQTNEDFMNRATAKQTNVAFLNGVSSDRTNDAFLNIVAAGQTNDAFLNIAAGEQTNDAFLHGVAGEQLKEAFLNGATGEQTNGHF